ncbi:hypothetical protein MAPG_05470 [Magnaporthiopsis poae ATCC 64411]|uniref:Uncharacterized protein n=1 Tax=Magnaporthiopsis poae (strain ATCC 64411 / 73-15) TaxID=644358 RepID=A0A0C4DZG8_MAGP6|nr:hypothetical protein MAPG_05470 [Magnaporthiopsis poae ATCC 64411]
MQVHRSVGPTVALDVLLRLDGEEDGEDVEDAEDAEMLVCSQAAWQKRLFMRWSDGGGGVGGSAVLRMLDVDPVQAH